MKHSSSIKTLLASEIDPAFAKRSEFILQAIANKKPKKILDAGCGRGFYVNALTIFDFPTEINGVDINENYLAKARKNIKDKRVRLQKGNIYELPFADNYFDAIICSEVLEHLDDDKKAVIELSRVLKKGGTLLVSVPNKNFPFLWDPLNWILMKIFHTHVSKNIWWLAGIWADHERLYTDKEIKKLLHHNFKVIDSNFFVRLCWPFSHFLLYGIGKNIVERLGTSKFDRFSTKRSTIGEIIAWLFSLPTKVATATPQSSVSLALVAEKK